MNEIKLEWNELLYYKDLKKATTGPGIYIWGFFGSSNFIPYYVGHAYDIQKRITEHLFRLIGGAYTIYNYRHLDKIYDVKFNNDWCIYNLSPNTEIVEFILNRNGKLRKHVNAMIENFYFTFAEVSDIKINRQLLDELEGAIINLLGGSKNYLSNQRASKNPNYKPLNIGNDIVVDLIHNFVDNITKGKNK